MAKIKSTLLDNSPSFKVVDKIKQLIKEDDVNQILIATGYWDIPGTALIAEELSDFLGKDGKSIKLLIGKDPTVFQNQLAELKRDDVKNTTDIIKIRLSELEPREEYASAVALLKKYCESRNPKFCIHTFKNPDDTNQFFHSKCWIFAAKAFCENESDDGLYAIIGSSNFTQKGMEGNSELNFLEESGYVINACSRNTPDQKGYIEWFKEKWELSSDWTKEFLLALNNSPVGKMQQSPNGASQCAILSPYEAYIKLLQDQFSEVIDSDGIIKEEDYLPKPSARNFKKLTYQLEAVNQGCAIMKRHGGFILADVVGLGKTYTALMVAKRHLLETGFKSPVLIITPPAVKKSWLDSIAFFDEDEIESRRLKPFMYLTTIGCLDTEPENAPAASENENVAPDDFDGAFSDADYGMIIVDESHRFRNDGTLMYQKLDGLIGAITARTGKQPYVALLSATPQNNTPYDLRNQIFLFQRNYRKSESIQNLGKHGSNLLEYFGEKQKNYLSYIKRDKPNPQNPKKERIPKSKSEIQEDRKKLREDSEDIRKKIIEPLVIRRTRTDIANFYKKDMESQNLHFPKIMPPQPLLYEMGEEQGRLFIDTIDIIASEVSFIDSDEDGNPLLGIRREPGVDALGYYRYRAIEYLSTDENKKRYEANNLDVSGTSERLAKLTELNLVKRLESSIAAFRESLHNLERYTQNMIDMYNADRIFICPDLDINKELSEENQNKNGGFEGCLNVIAGKAKKANEKHQTSRNAEYRKSDFLDSYIKKLNNDLLLIKDLCEKWDKQTEETEDKKMQNFIWTAASTIFDKKRNPSQHLVIFTECIRTQKELYKVLSSSPIKDYGILSVDASNRDELKETIAANFDANYKGDLAERERNRYKILITTDVLAEGVNLHRANSILNYDSPWNATRLMQRLGRINRIGTQADKIWNYNFYPSTLGDSQINLKNRTYVKLQSFHELFGEDSQIFSKAEEVKHFGKVEYEAAEDSQTPIMPFIAELKEFRENHGGRYSQLMEIKNFACATVEDERKQAFSCLHENDEKGKTLRSMLYVSDENGKSRSMSQLDFFERLKPFALLQSAEMSGEDVQKYKKSVLDFYAMSKQNAQISLRGKTKTGEKEQKSARKKILALYDIPNLSEEYVKKLDEISDLIQDKNHGLIKKVLEMDLRNDGLVNMQVEADIDTLHKFAQNRISSAKAEVAIQFVVR